MKIIFNKNDMCEAVSPLQSGVSGKTALTATEGILFEAQAPDVCRMTTFDLEKGVRLSVRVEVIEEGAAIISAAKIQSDSPRHGGRRDHAVRGMTGTAFPLPAGARRTP